MTGQLISQPYPSRDSSVIANKDLRKAAILIEQGKVNIAELRLQRQRVDLLQQSSDAKDSIISGQANTISLKSQMIYNYMAIDSANRQVIKIKDEAMGDLRKSLRCQKTRTWIATIVAAASLVLLVVK